MSLKRQYIYSLCLILNAIPSIYLAYIYSFSEGVWFGLTIFLTYFLIFNAICGVCCVFDEISPLAIIVSSVFFASTFSETDTNLIKKYENIHAKNICDFLQDWEVSHKIADSHLVYQNSSKDFTQGNYHDNILLVKNEVKNYYNSLNKIDMDENQIDKRFNRDWLEFVKWFSTHEYPKDGSPFKPMWKPNL